MISTMQTDKKTKLANSILQNHYQKILMVHKDDKEENEPKTRYLHRIKKIE